MGQKLTFFRNGIAEIEREGRVFKIPAEDFTANQLVFKCKKCGYIWLPKNRNFDSMPLHCPKCLDKYWFMLREESRIKKKQITKLEEPKIKTNTETSKKPKRIIW